MAKNRRLCDCFVIATPTGWENYDYLYRDLATFTVGE